MTRKRYDNSGKRKYDLSLGRTIILSLDNLIDIALRITLYLEPLGPKTVEESL